jgi:AbrB family looped-hinge helix DNA binding protein
MTRHTCRVNSRGQITVPMEIRKRLGVEPADRFEFEEQGDGIFLRPVGSKFIDLATITHEARDHRPDELEQRFNVESLRE